MAIPTRNELDVLVNTNLPDNNSRLITAAKQREVLSAFNTGKLHVGDVLPTSSVDTLDELTLIVSGLSSVSAIGSPDLGELSALVLSNSSNLVELSAELPPLSAEITNNTIRINELSALYDSLSGNSISSEPVDLTFLSGEIDNLSIVVNTLSSTIHNASGSYIDMFSSESFAYLVENELDESFNGWYDRIDDGNYIKRFYAENTIPEIISTSNIVDNVGSSGTTPLSSQIVVNKDLNLLDAQIFNLPNGATFDPITKITSYNFISPSPETPVKVILFDGKYATQGAFTWEII